MEVLTDDKSDLMSIDELADLIGMSRKFILKYRQNGRLPGVIRIADQTYKYNRRVIEKRLENGELLLPK